MCFLSYTGRMQKIIGFFMFISLCCLGALFVLKHIFVAQIITQVNALNTTLDTSYVKVTYQSAESTCLFAACVLFKDVHITAMGHPMRAGNILIKIPVSYPIKLDIQSQQTDQPTDLILNATLQKNVLNISKLSCSIDDFFAQVSGTINTQIGTVQLSMQTINLADFIRPYVPYTMQKLADLFIYNRPQQLDLVDKDGWLTVQGIPLFPIQTKQNLLKKPLI